MRGHCFIHIGAPKTGTTFLQKILFNNRSALARHNVLYPDVSLRGYGHHDIAFLLSGGYPAWATSQPRSLDELQSDLADIVRDHRGDILLSSEDFYLFPAPQALKALLESAGALRERAPIVIAYLRRQDAAHESWYNQTIKAQGETHAFADCVTRWHDLWNYETQLERWASVFGASAIVVRPYEEVQWKNHSLVDDFFDRIGVPVASLEIPSERENTGLNKDLLEFARLFNHLPLDVIQKRQYHRELISLSARSAGTGIFDETPTLGGAQRREILSGYRSGNAAVAQKYLGREHLFLTEPDAAPETVPAPHLGTEKLAYILGWLMANK